ncbi:MAG TPA: squalene/phytoene synthase family protein [Xanthobacteraceae bacterium]
MQDAFSHCEALLRAVDRDRFLTALFAPADRRPALLALYAFNAEIARVREVAHQPLAGEVRLQWWRDLLGGESGEAGAGNPVAAALLATITGHGLPTEPLRQLVEARRFDLYEEPMPSLAELERYLEATSCGLIGVAAHALVSGDCGMPGLVRAVGLAYGITALLKAFPVHAGRGQLFIPLDLLERHGAARAQATSGGPASPALRAALAELRGEARRHLDAARALLGTAPAAALPALLPAALVAPVLARMERRDYEPFAPVEIAAWRRQWLIWCAAARPQGMFG